MRKAMRGIRSWITRKAFNLEAQDSVFPFSVFYNAFYRVADQKAGTEPDQDFPDRFV
jgi:hypothetical protein